MRYVDRRDAGRRLVAPVRDAIAPANHPIVLGLPRGGVPVAAEVAAGIGADLDVLVVRKVGVPGHEELAMGAVASGGVRSRVDAVLASTRIRADRLERAFQAAEAELAARERTWRGNRPPLDLTGRDVVLVDDGLATGASMTAAVEAARQHGPARVVVAVPVGAARSLEDLRRTADLVVCPYVPFDFRAVGLHYDDFDQTSDAEVRALLARPPGSA